MHLRTFACAFVCGLVVPFGSGCESCAMHLGTFDVLVQVTPSTARASVSMCSGGRCQHLTTEAGKNRPAYYHDQDPPEGSVRFSASPGEGFRWCWEPAMTIAVEAPGCEPVTVTRKRRRFDGNTATKTMIAFPIALKCDASRGAEPACGTGPA